uniref:Uncharacterized protein n=1 Tax=Magnusiomyces tetraspermus TaxID=1232584 RepID=A0A023UPM1_9ASCO|nr:hypothetical protein [Magnusiomyces tetraspermus]AHY04922.1 hypothetical protein [Magnusiomyces tetraspermus]
MGTRGCALLGAIDCARQSRGFGVQTTPCAMVGRSNPNYSAMFIVQIHARTPSRFSSCRNSRTTVGTVASYLTFMNNGFTWYDETYYPPDRGRETGTFVHTTGFPMTTRTSIWLTGRVIGVARCLWTHIASTFPHCFRVSKDTPKWMSCKGSSSPGPGGSKGTTVQ